MTYLFQAQQHLKEFLSDVEDFADIILTQEGVQVKVYTEENQESLESIKDFYCIEG